MTPIIDVKVTKGGPFPAAFIYLKYSFQQGETWPEEIRKEQCLTLDCASVDELQAEVEKLKSELDMCVTKAKRSLEHQMSAGRFGKPVYSTHPAANGSLPCGKPLSRRQKIGLRAPKHG